MRSIDIRTEVNPNDNEYHGKENVTCRNQEGAELLDLKFMDHIPKIQRKSQENQHRKMEKSHHPADIEHRRRV
jgi:hypothetical protein